MLKAPARFEIMMFIRTFSYEAVRSFTTSFSEFTLILASTETGTSVARMGDDFASYDSLDLAKQYRLGSTEALTELVLRNRERLEAHAARFVGRHRAEDLVGDLIVKLIEVGHSYDGRPWLPWTRTILRNMCIDWLRCEARHKLALSSYPHRGVGQGDPIELRELSEGLKVCLKSLPDAARKLISLRFFDGLNFEQIAEYFKISVSTAHRQLGEAMNSLKICLQGHSEVGYE